MQHRTVWQWPPLFLVLLTLCAWGSPSITAGDTDGPQISPAALTAIQQEHAPTVTAASSLLADTATQVTLWGDHPDVRRAPASLTKLMTALVVEQNDAPTKVIYVSTAAAGTPGSRMGLSAGQRLTVDELLHGLFLPSGNDAAEALAEGTSGTEAAFVAKMNAQAQAMGLTGTHFVNPHGLDATGHYSTAHDLAVMAFQALRDPLLASIVRTRHWEMTGPNGQVLFSLNNLNELLGTYPGADGVKTGTTAAAGENLVASATRNGHQLLTVVLGSTDRYADARAILDYGWQHWQWVAPETPPLVAAGDGAVHLRFGTWQVQPLPVWEASDTNIVLHVDQAALAGVKSGPPQQVGTVLLRLGQEVVGQAPVMATRP